MLARMTDHPLAAPLSYQSGNLWFVFYTHIAAEKRAERSVSDLGYKTYVPFEKRILRRPGKKPRQYETALFPRYGFVNFDPNRDEWGEIKYADGVYDILRNNSVPVSVPERFIGGLRVADDLGTFDRTKPPRKDLQVLITHGPYADFVGRVVKARSKDRVKVLLKMFGTERAVDIPLMHLREV